MAIPYSLTLRSSNPLDANAVKKVYAHAQYHELMSLDTFARHIAEHGCSFSRATIAAVLTEAVDCLREQLLLGNKVQLGEMGSFSVSLRSRGAESADAFNAAGDVLDVQPRWERSSKFESLMKDASFTYVGTRDSQADAKKAEKAAIDTALGITTPANGGGGGTGNLTGGGTVEE